MNRSLPNALPNGGHPAGPVVAFIFARGGSKGVPRKNIRDFAGKPLIAHSIAVAKQSRLIERIVVSTEDEEIAAIARQYGAEAPFLRPAELAGDRSSEFLAWKHAIFSLRSAGQSVGTFVSVPATSPLRIPDDLDRCIRKLHESEADLVLTVTPARRHPMYNMVVFDNEGLVRIATPPPATIHTRQEAPAVFDVDTVAYAARPDFILEAETLLGGRTTAVVVPEERSIDIDTELDFAVAEFLFLRRQKEQNP